MGAGREKKFLAEKVQLSENDLSQGAGMYFYVPARPQKNTLVISVLARKLAG